MLLTRTICKTKKFFNKSLQNLKSFLFGGYKKLPRAPSLSLFSSDSKDPKMQQLDNFYEGFCEQWESEITPTNKIVINSEQRVSKNKEENGGIQVQKRASYHEEKKKEDVCPQSGNKGSHLLAQKMKELEMMDVHDVDHVLDVEEVLHYYSRLTSPIYQDLVNTFFMDMYSEFSLPQPSVSKNSSMRRLGPLKI